MRIRRILATVLSVEADQLTRATPFFSVYLCLFAALTMADAIAVTLFASRVGAAALPLWYSITAVCSLLVVSIYLVWATVVDSSRLFSWILCLIATVWMLAWGGQVWLPGPIPAGIMFVSREMAQTLVLMHFGTFLQDYFLRSELNRILPVIYAGGRVGGIAGGACITVLAERLGTANLILIAVGLVSLAWIGILLIRRLIHQQDELETENRIAANAVSSTEMANAANSADSADSARVAASTSADTGTFTYRMIHFTQQVISIPLLKWLTVGTLCFVGCRWILAYQYTATFETEFADEAALARFLGFYTQIALAVSLLMQLLLVNRIVNWIGVANTHWVYSFIVLSGLAGNLLWIGLPIAVASRFIEAELRFGLRNPVNQMLINRFSKKMRIVVRGWSLGFLIPVGTLMVSGVIYWLLNWQGTWAVAVAGVLVGVAYLVSSWKIGQAYQNHK